MDKKKLQIIAGSFKEAFGTNPDSRFSGIVELDGIPTRPHLQNVRQRPIEEASDFTAPNDHRRKIDGLTQASADRGFALASASLRQALNDMPEIAQVSKNIVIEETKEGLNISLIDQDGRAMFAEGAVHPFERTRKVLETIAPVVRRMPNRIMVSGHTSSVRPGQRRGGSPWELSVGRAASVRDILSSAGIPDERFASVIGKADNDPMFPDNPFLAANRRVTITLVKEAPPLPPGLRP
jgi:chemotaxis protein MotB